MVIELAGTIEPTERSRCPAIISSPTGSAMMPSSEATLSQLAAPPADRKLAPPKIEKKTSTAIMPISEPTSGRRTRLPIEGIEECARRAARSLPWMVGQWLRISWKCPWRCATWSGLAPTLPVGGATGNVRPSDASSGRTFGRCGVSGRRPPRQPSSRRRWRRRRSPVRSAPASSAGRARS